MPPKLPHRHRCPPRDWRSLLPNLARIVPWPHGGGGTPTEVEVLENVLGYIRYLQRSISIARGGANNGDPPPNSGPPQLGGKQPPPSSPPTSTTSSPPPRGHAGDTQSPPQQKLVPYAEDEELGGGTDPWLCPTGPYWEALVSAGGGPLSSPPRLFKPGGALLGLSPSLLASPPPPGSPNNVLRGDTTVPPVPSGGATSGGGGRRQEEVGGDDPRGGREAEGGPHAAEGSGGARPPQRPKKKCLNGFIMFCRLNRREYISAHPGLASTVATRELARLWRSLSPAQRRPYCHWARRFSRQHDRVVRRGGDEDGDSDSDPPAPLRLLMATHDGGGGPGGHPPPPP